MSTHEHGKITGRPTKEKTSQDFELCWHIDVHDVACVDLAVPRKHVVTTTGGFASLTGPQNKELIRLTHSHSNSRFSVLSL